jgi:hypothetical protein
MKKSSDDLSEVNTNQFKNADWGLEDDVRNLEEASDQEVSEAAENTAEAYKYRGDVEKQETLTGAIKPRSKFWGLGIALLFIVAALVVWLLGQQQLVRVSSFLTRLTLRSKPQVTLLESQNDKSLLLETEGKRNRVLVQQAGREGWLLVSQDDFTAANPTLSPDGAWVAYLSTQNAPEIVIVPLENAERITYESADLATFGRRRDIDVASICDWTSIAWGADGEHLAFFGCAEDPPVSQVFVAELSPEDSTLTPSLITGTVASGVDPRQILWLGANQISVTFPPTKTTKVETVETFSIH